MIGRIFGCTLLAMLPLLASAADGEAPRGLISAEVETQTAHWLRVQREGTQASTHPQSLTPAERELAMQRLLESYKYPIPEFFQQDVGGEMSQ